jgi:hypothetical protein
MWPLRCALALAVTGWLLAGASAADAFVYWPSAVAKTIGRANLDGTGVENSFVKTAGTPCGVASNGVYVYWAAEEGGVGHVGRANLATGVAEDHFITTADPLPCGVAVDSGHVYFNNFSHATIARTNLDGGEIEQEWVKAGAGTNPQHPSVDGTHIYWSNKGFNSNPAECPPGCTIGQANVNGSEVVPAFVKETSDPPSGTATDGKHVYWGNGSAIGRVNPDGSGVEPSFITTAHFVCAVAVDSSHIYWAGANKIGRANLNGTEINNEFITTSGSSCGVAVDALTTPPPALRATKTQVSCNYFFATFLDTCTATVLDIAGTGETTPGGQVNFSASEGGVFTVGASCALSLVPMTTSASCSVEYLPPAIGSPTVTAAYKGGDGVHAPSSATTSMLLTGLGSGHLIGTLGITPTTFGAAESGAAYSSRSPRGARVRYTLHGPARVVFTVERRLPGRKGRHGKCERQTSHNAKHGRCTRYSPLRGSFALVGASGANSFLFRGRIGGRTLARGKYRLVATPSIGRYTGLPTYAPFGIKRPGRR